MLPVCGLMIITESSLIDTKLKINNFTGAQLQFVNKLGTASN